jgi:hypothetical protein
VDTEISYTSKLVGISLFIGITIFCLINIKEIPDININSIAHIINTKEISEINIDSIATVISNKKMPSLDNLEKAYPTSWDYCSPPLEPGTTNFIFSLQSGKVITIPVLDMNSLSILLGNLKPETSILFGNKICTKVFISNKNYYVDFTGDQFITLPLPSTNDLIKIHHADLVGFYSQILAYLN